MIASNLEQKLTLSVLNILAISGTNGSSGLGSHKREQIDNSTEMRKKKGKLGFVISSCLYSKQESKCRKQFRAK